MQRKNCTPAPQFVLKDRSNQELVDGAKHLVGRSRAVTAHLIAHLAEIYARKLHVAEGFSYLGDYCVGALGLSEDEGHRRAHAAVLAHKYPIILDMLLEGSIHLTTLRAIGKCLTPQNHQQVLKAARGKNRSELEHLAAALAPKPDVPTALRKLPEPRPENARSEDTILANDQVVSAVDAQEQAGQISSLHSPANGSVESASVEIMGTAPYELAIASTGPTPLVRWKSRIAPLSPGRYNLNLTINKDAYDALRELQDLLRHQVPNGDLVTIVQDSILERRDRVKRKKFGHGKRSRNAHKQESWIEAKLSHGVAGEGKTLSLGVVPNEKLIAEVGTRDDEAVQALETRVEQVKTQDEQHVESEGVLAIAPGRLENNSRHIPAAVKREVWERDKARCAFVSRSGRRCSEKGRLEFHHVHAYALGGPATVENIALRCRTHNAYEGVALFGENKALRRGANTRERSANRPGAIGRYVSTNTTKTRCEHTVHKGECDGARMRVSPRRDRNK